MLQLIAARVDDTSAGGIAAAIGALIGEGVLLPGDQLPTVRSLAVELGVSTGTVSDAWRVLQNHGAISTDRRRGTKVRSNRSTTGGRYWQVPVQPGTIELDLSTGTPDSELLPPLGPILKEVHADLTLTSYVDPPVLPELEAELRQLWPFAAETITVVDGAQDALDRTVAELVGLGDLVVVEDPTFPPLLDMLELAGARIVGVPIDGDGPRLDALTEAMARKPRALFIQPRAHNPTGVHISRHRARAIAALVDGTQTVVVEDDHSGATSGVAIESVGEFVAGKVVHIHSFSKSHGPDLRIAAIGGPAELVDRVVRRRQLGPSWTSRLIQQILLVMLRDPRIDELIASAAVTYQRRRADLEVRLARRGVLVSPGVGLNMWIPVDDEQRAVVALAAHGIGVAPGRPFRAMGTAGATGSDTPERLGPHIRLSLGALRPKGTALDRIAATIAAAAAPPPTGLAH